MSVWHVSAGLNLASNLSGTIVQSGKQFSETWLGMELAVELSTVPPM